MAAAMAVINMGVEAWLQLGTADSPGTKWFCLSGHLARPGLYEVPFGLTIRDLIGMAGGVPGNKEVQAVLLGGAAGVLVPVLGYAACLPRSPTGRPIRP